MVKASPFAAAAAALAASVAIVSPGLVRAADRPPPAQEEVRALREAYETQRVRLEALRRRLDALERAVAEDERGTRPATAKPAVYRPGAGGNPGAGADGPRRPVPAAEERRMAQAGQPGQAGQQQQAPAQEQRRQEVQPALQAISDRAGVLTPRGTMVVEPRLEYTNDNRRRVLVEGFSIIPAINIGNIDVREVNRDTLTGTLTARYGFTSRFEADVSVPYLYRTQDTTSRPIGVGATQDTTDTIYGNGIGDVQFGLHYQLNSGLADWPVFIANTLVRAPTGKDVFEIDVDQNGLEQELPTGSGFWGVEPSITFLYPSDPVVFWGTGGYLFNIGEDKETQTGATTDVEPGDAVRLSMGMGIALNERSSIGLGYQHDLVFETEQDGQKIDNSGLQVGTILLSGTHRLSPTTSLSMQLNFGVTEDAPDIRVVLRLPIAISIF